ncbi:MAG: hypothetical protein ACR2NP_02470, partial [Pirellulaceae bacterium]
LGQDMSSDAEFVAATLSQFDQLFDAGDITPSDAPAEQPFGWVDVAATEPATTTNNTAEGEKIPLAEPVNRPAFPSIKTSERLRSRSSRSTRIWASIIVGVPLMIGLIVLIWPAGDRARQPTPAVAQNEERVDEKVEAPTQPEEPVAQIPGAEPEASEPASLEPASPEPALPEAAPSDGLVDDDQNIANRDQKIALDWNHRVVPETEKDLGRPETTVQPEMRRTFAAVFERGRCSWDGDITDWSTLGIGEVTLRTGRARLDLDNGYSFDLRAPVTLRLDGPEQITVIRGTLQGDSRNSESDVFVIRTGNVQVQPHADAEFSVQVKSVADEVAVDDGAVDVVPWYGRSTDDSILLSRGGLDKAVIQDFEDQRGGPIHANFRNSRNDDYEGWVHVEGQVLKSRNLQFVKRIYRLARERYMDSPQELRREWDNLMSLMRSGQNMGVPNIGRSMPGTEFDQIMAHVNGAMNQVVDPAQARFFQGTFEFNGQRMQFNSPEEFAAAQREIFGSFAETFDHFQNNSNQPQNRNR